MAHTVYDTDKHFTIDLTTGTLTSQMSKISIVKSSHNAERFTFDFPRTVEGHDLTLCNNVEVHFLNIDAVTKETSIGTYKVDDVQAIDEEQITFSWLIDGRATKYGGTMRFSIHFKCMEDGKLVYRFPTAVYSGILISDGIDHGDEIIEEYNDIVTAWMNEIEQSVKDTIRDVVDESIGDTVSEAVDKVVEETVGVAVDKAVDEALGNSAINTDNYANAIKANVSGTSITIDDLSPLTSKLKVKVVGKQPPEAPAALMMMRSVSPAATSDELVNLIPFTRDDGELGYKDAKVGDIWTQGGITYRVNGDGSITVWGVASGLSQFTLYQSYEILAPFDTSKRYTINAVPDGVLFGFSVYNSDKNESAVNGTVAVWAKGYIIRLTVKKDTDLSNSVTVYPMIVEGEDGAITGYVPPQGATPDGGDHTHRDENPKDHVCDICGERLSACVDNNNDHICDYCGEVMPDAPHVDSDLDHDCDECGATMGAHRDDDGDGFCDYCGESMHTCADNNKDHKCDICGKVLSECEDSDLDHDCDICGATMGRHWDDTQDHLCDYCGEVVTDHVDEDMNHVCDVCGHVMGEHKDNGKGYCDYCGASMHDCVDTDGDGLCDICGVDIHICADDDNDHFCDKCGKRLSECKDDNLDHVCDICGKEMGSHADGGKDHKCDYCGGSGFGVHADEDGDGFCDYCGEPIIAVTLSIASADDPDTIIKTIKTTYGAIVEIAPILPSMIITVDKDDAILSAEYNKDTNAVIEELREAIEEGGGGADGYTPQKGVDYWTDEDKAEIKAYVDDAILGGAW